VNVKRLAIEVARAISGIGNNLLFEQLTNAIRDRFVTATSLQLSTIQQAKGIKGFKVICDDTNNTEVDRENNKLNATVLVQPVESIEYIVLDFIITNSGTFLLV
jgi:phage tail sheath protein FI